MANSLKGTVWTIDTGSSTALWTSDLWVKEMSWAPNAVDDDLDVQDKRGSSIWKVRAKIAAGANEESIGLMRRTFEGGRGMRIEGLKVATIDGGKLRVMLG